MNAKQWMQNKKIDPLSLINKRLRIVSLSVNTTRPETLIYEGKFKGLDNDGHMIFDDGKVLKYPIDMLTRIWELK